MSTTTCEPIKQQLVDYEEGWLKQDARQHIEAHLKECDACAQEFEELQKSLMLYTDMEKCSQEVEPSPFLISRILYAAEANERKKILPVFKLSGVLAAVLFIVVLSFYHKDRTPETKYSVNLSEKTKTLLIQTLRENTVVKAEAPKEKIAVEKSVTRKIARHRTRAKHYALKKTHTKKVMAASRPAQEKSVDTTESMEIQYVTDENTPDDSYETAMLTSPYTPYGEINPMNQPNGYAKPFPPLFPDTVRIHEILKTREEEIASMEAEKHIAEFHKMLGFNTNAHGNMNTSIMP